MKTLKHYLLYFVILIAFSDFVSGQIIFTSVPDSTSMINEPYTYDVDAAGAPSIVYSLDKALTGMTIVPGTGVISWTPTSLQAGGKVIVKATSGALTRTQEYYLYVAGAIECLNNAISYWKFDETSGTTYKDSYGTHNAVATSTAPIDSGGIVGRSKNVPKDILTGMEVTDHTDFQWGANQSFSISFWYKSNILDRAGLVENVGVILGRNEGSTGGHWWIGLNEINELTFLVRDIADPATVFDAYLNGTRFYNNLNWHHIVCVRDAATSKIKIYYDGTLPADPGNIKDFPGTRNWFGADGSAPLSIGFLKPVGGGASYPMNGSIDELTIYSRALTDGDITNLYTQGAAHNPACPPGNSAALFVSVPDTVTDEDQPYSYQLLARDIDGDALSYSPVNLPSWITYTAGTKTLSGTPTNANVGNTTVEVKVNDGTIDAFQSFNLRVANVNDDPTITSTAVLTVNEETAYSYDVQATDVDAGDVLTYSLTQKPAWLSINAGTGLISGTPPVNDTAEHAVTVRVADVAGAFDEESFTLDVRNVNDLPQLAGQNTIEVNEDNSIQISKSQLTITDVDNQQNDITVSVVAGTNYTFTGNNVTPAANFNGNLTVNISLSDLSGSASAQVTVNVIAVNDAPVITAAPASTAWEGQAYSYIFNATDADGDNLTYLIPQLPAWLTWFPATRIIAGTPSITSVGTHTLVIRVTDPSNASDSDTVEIVVGTTNHIPFITSTPPATGTVGELYLYNVTYTDGDAGDVLTLSAPVLPSWLTLNAASGVLSGTPSGSDLGTDTAKVFNVKLKISDGKQDSTQTFTIRVRNSTGIRSHDVTNLVRIYPVPAVDYVRFELNSTERLTVEISDITGKVVYSNNIDTRAPYFEVNTTRFRKGIYFFRIASQEKYQVGKFTILK